MPFPQQVDSNRIMKTNFITSIDQDTFGGVLLYHLRRKEDAKDTSTSTQLLLIWGRRHNEPYSHALLIEHESTFVWKKDKLKRLYDEYNSQYDIGPGMESWLLNDDSKLRIMVKTSHNGFEMEVVISDGKHLLCLIRPLWVDPNR
jgi:hypothetical protein